MGRLCRVRGSCVSCAWIVCVVRGSCTRAHDSQTPHQYTAPTPLRYAPLRGAISTLRCGGRYLETGLHNTHQPEHKLIIIRLGIDLNPNRKTNTATRCSSSCCM